MTVIIMKWDKYVKQLIIPIILICLSTTKKNKESNFKSGSLLD